MPMGVFGASASPVNVGAAAMLAFSSRGWSEIVSTVIRRCVGCAPAATSRPSSRGAAGAAIIGPTPAATHRSTARRAGSAIGWTGSRGGGQRLRKTATVKRCSPPAGVWCTSPKPRVSENASPSSRASASGL